MNKDDTIKALEDKNSKLEEELKKLKNILQNTQHLQAKKYIMKNIKKNINKELENTMKKQDTNLHQNKRKRKLTRSWMETQTRPSEFTRKQGLSPVLDKTGESKTIVATTT
jgi:hypothetical protein